ncbi:SDR family oxidoreductase [Streptomyces sp. NPDC051320]|uniref:SDR family NAD(P)-dependent oxidoreductase n=1 Tax=Streptomyces sp. NPDC051320 TaxID=3154644 RepID=UPI00342FCB3B
MNITDKVILITGASSGIGAATARAAADVGARLVLAARRTERIEALARDLPQAIAVTCDVTDAAQVNAAVQAGIDHYGRIDILVNNAGRGLHLPLEDVDPGDFRTVLEINVVAPLVAMQAVLPLMRAQGSGSIVNVSSTTTHMVLPGLGAYAASKSALNMLSAVARRELAADGIVVSTIHPFITATEFHQTLGAGQIVPAAADFPVHSAEDVAGAVLELIRTGEAEASLIPDEARSAAGFSRP